MIAPIGAADSDTRRRSDKVLKHIIAPVAEARGYEVQRADQISEPGLITSQVIQRIVEDPLVIADLSEWNPNVFYELALRHALRKPLVQLIAEGERIPFDVAAMRTVSFDVTDLDSVEAAKAEIGRQIEALEREPDNVETPVSFTLDIRALREGGNPEARSLAEVVEAVSEMRSGMRELTMRTEMSVAETRALAARDHGRADAMAHTLSDVNQASSDLGTEFLAMGDPYEQWSVEEFNAWKQRMAHLFLELDKPLRGWRPPPRVSGG